MKQQLLLLEDVDALGKKGEIVSARPGYVRNFLLPQGLAVVATENTLRKQERLRAERAKQAIIDQKASEELAGKVLAINLSTVVKVDPEGRMYGSVSALDIANLFQQQGLDVEKKMVMLNKPIKETGLHKINLKFKEGITAVCELNIIPEGGRVVAAVEVAAKPVEEVKE
jgi:large subunit ribosomal protein L9